MGYEIEARVHEENCRNVKHLVGILKMMQSPESLLQDLLEVIDEIFDDADEEEVELLELEEAYLLSLTCRHHLVHNIYHEEAFGLLELAEGMMGTCLQQIRTFSADTTTDLDDWPRDIFKQAVASRLARQTELIRDVNVECIFMSSRHCLGATLLQKAQILRTKTISLGDFDQKDWAWFADQSQQIIKQLEEENTLEDLPSASSLCEIIIVGEETIGKAKLRELKTVWEAIDKEEGYMETAAGVCTERGQFLRSSKNTIWRTCIHDDDENGELNGWNPCPYQNDVYANVEECGWRRLQEIWRKGQKQCIPLSIE